MKLFSKPPLAEVCSFTSWYPSSQLRILKNCQNKMDFSFYVLQKAIRTTTSVHASVVNQRKTLFFSFKNLMFSNFVCVTLFLMTSLNLNFFFTNNLRRVV